MPGLDPRKFPGTGESTVKLKAMDVSIRDLVRSLGDRSNPMSFYSLLTRYITEGLVFWCTAILDWAVSLAPYDTGELRRSGVVNFYLGDSRTSILVADTTADSEGNYEVHQKIDSVKTGTSRVEAEVSFFREGVVKDEEGRVIAVDVALWAHEDLLPWVPRPKKPEQYDEWYATKKGTGPKYLAQAAAKYQGKLDRIVSAAVAQAMEEYNKRLKATGTHATVPRYRPPVSFPKAPTRKEVWSYREAEARRTGFFPSYKKAKSDLWKKRVRDYLRGE